MTIDLAEQCTGVTVSEANDDEVLVILDARAHAELGISGDTFLDRLRVGAYDGQDEPVIQRLIGIAALLG